MLRRFLLTLVLAISTLTQAHAADGVKGINVPSKEPPMPTAIQEQKDRGAQVYYLGKFDTLDGWMMIRTGQPEFYYATPGNKALVMGILFNELGQMLTGEQVKALEVARATQLGSVAQAVPAAPAATATATTAVPTAAAPAAAPAQTAVNPIPGVPPIRTAGNISDTPPAPKSDAEIPNTPAGQLYSQVMNTANVLWGKPGVPAFWAFLDPNCPHCQAFLKEVEPFVTSGQIAVHIIPVAYDEKSKKQGAYVLAAADGPQRLLGYAKGDASLLPVSPDMSIDAVSSNLDTMRKWKLSGTPIIVYQAGKSGEVHLIRGRPVDINEAIADLKG